MFTPPGGTPRPMIGADLDTLLARADREPDGSYRVIASKALEGRPIGRIRFYGTRPDDPNDLVPHEMRRELRGYGTFAAWFNHVDAKAGNALDTVVDAGGHSTVRHHLIDFGSTLGSGALAPREEWEGYEYMVQPKDVVKGIAAFGFYILPWRTVPYYDNPAIGRLPKDNTRWNPDAWRPRVPNPAFVRARADDKFWAARKAAAITDDLVDAAVAAGQFGNPDAEAFLAKAIKERRDAIVRAYLPAVNPVVDVALSPAGVLTFGNAAVDCQRRARAGGIPRDVGPVRQRHGRGDADRPASPGGAEVTLTRTADGRRAASCRSRSRPDSRCARPVAAAGGRALPAGGERVDARGVGEGAVVPPNAEREARNAARHSSGEEGIAELFRPQRLRRIDRGGLARRDEARGERAGREHERDRRERRRVPRLHAEQQAAHQARGAERSRETEPDAERRQPSRLAEHQPVDAAALRPERHADADLARPLADRVGDRRRRARSRRAAARAARSRRPGRPTTGAGRPPASCRSARASSRPPRVTMSRSICRMTDVIAAAERLLGLRRPHHEREVAAGVLLERAGRAPTAWRCRSVLP